MIRYELTFKGKTIFIPFNASTLITKRYEEAPRLSVGLCDQDNNIVNWIPEETLSEGDEITLELKEIDAISEPVEIFNFFKRMGTTKEASDQAALERYRMLKKELKEEGLI